MPGILLDGVCDRCLLSASVLWPSDAPDERIETESALPNSEANDESALKRFGDYELLEKIASGGMGTVYRGRQLSLNRLVAIKLIHGGQLARSSAVQRFKTEAIAIARLRHPNIVAVFEAGEFEMQRYLVMELVDGPDLGLLIQESRWSFNEIATLIRKIADAVQHAHLQGVLHRDLKPSNILIGADGDPRISDFGLAVTEGADSHHTVTGAIVGSPAYMAPELFQGGSKAATAASDVFSIGAVLYELLIGSPPYSGATQVELIRNAEKGILVAPSRVLDGIPRDLETICLKCTDRTPSNRYQSARELADELQRFLDGEPIHGRRCSHFERSWRWVQRYPALASSVALTFVLLTTVSAFSALSWKTAKVTAKKENRLRVEAEHHAYESQLNAYDSDMLLAGSAIKDGKNAMARELISKYEPQWTGNNAKDIRGWEWGHYSRLLESEAKRVLSGHSAEIRTLAVSDDGRWLLSTDSTKEVIAWDLKTFHPAWVVRLKHRPTATRFLPDGKSVLVGTGGAIGENLVYCLSVTNGETQFSAPLPTPVLGISADSNSSIATVLLMDRVATLSISTKAVLLGNPFNSSGFGAAPAKGNEYFALAGHDNWFRWWPVHTNGAAHLDWEYPLNQYLYAFCVVISPLDGTAAVGFNDGIVRLWKPGVAKPFAFLGESRTAAIAACFSSDGRELAIGYGDSTIEVWDLKEQRRIRRFDGHAGAIQSVAFIPNSHELISGSWDGTIRIWSPENAFRDHLTFPLPAKFSSCYSSDGRFTVRCDSSKGGELALMDTASGSIIASTKDRFCQQWSVTSERPQIVVGHPSGEIQVLEPVGTNLVVVRSKVAHKKPIEVVQIDERQNALFSLDASHHLVVSSIHNLAVVDEFDLNFDGKASDFSVAPGLRWMVVFRVNAAPILVDLVTRRPCSIEVPIDRRVVNITVSQDQKRTAIVLDRGEVLVMELPSSVGSSQLSLKANIKTWPIAACSAAFSSDGKRLAIGLDSGGIRVHDLMTNREIARMDSTPIPLEWIEFSGFPERLVGYTRGTAEIWESTLFRSPGEESADRSPKTLARR